jgi:hypothetical protein
MQNRILFISSLILAILFVLTSWMWFWLFNLFVSLPVGLISLVLLLIYRSKYGMDRGAVIIARLLTLGLITALIGLGLFL